MRTAGNVLRRVLRNFRRQLTGTRQPTPLRPQALAGTRQLTPLRPQALAGTRQPTPFRALGGVLLLVSGLLLMGASGDRTGQRFDRLGHALMCQCGCGQVLLECNHVGCSTSEEMRKELKAAMERGDSDKVILAGFVSKYGPTVLSAPTTTGFNRVAWIMPPVIFIVGLAAVVLVVRRWKHRTPPAPPPSSAASGAALDEFRRRAREETSL